MTVPPCPAPTAFPCPCPPFSQPVGGLVAAPAPYPHYVIPCSHLLDPPYATQLNPNFPFPRAPRAWESETRAAGTGLIWGPSSAAAMPCPPSTMALAPAVAPRLLTFRPPPPVPAAVAARAGVRRSGWPLR